MFRNKNNSTLTTASQIPLVPYHHRSPSDASYRKTSTPGRDGLVQDPPGWPAEPQPLTRSIFDSVIEGAVDLVIVVLSFVFLIFGFTVLRYDQAPVAEHQELARDLVAATKYVSSTHSMSFDVDSLTCHRDRRSFPSSSLQWWGAPSREY